MYDAHSTLNSKGFTFKKEQPSHLDINVPGPGSYDANPAVLKSHSPESKIGRSKRGNNFDSPSKDLPGPGMYNAPSTLNS